MVAPMVGVVARVAAMELSEWPPKSLLGTRPEPMSARERWEQRMEAGKERRERATGGEDNG